MTWVQNVDKRTRFTEMSSEPHARKFGAAGGFPPGVSISTPCVPCGVGSEAVTALFLLVSVPRRARFWHRHSAHGSGRGDCHWHFAPFCRRPQPPFVSLLCLCSPFLHILKITVLLLNSSSLPFPVHRVVTPVPAASPLRAGPAPSLVCPPAGRVFATFG